MIKPSIRATSKLTHLPKYAFLGLSPSKQTRDDLLNSTNVFRRHLSNFREDPSKVTRIHFPESLEQRLSPLIPLLPSPYQKPNEVANTVANELKRLLPTENLNEFQAMVSTGKPGILIIENFPTGAIPAGIKGESIEERSARKSIMSQACILGIAEIMGHTLYSHPNEQGGKIIHSIAPIEGLEKTQSSKGREPFKLHTENPFEQNPPHFLMLVGLEGDPHAQTSYLPLGNVFKRLSPFAIDAMKKREFRIISGAGFDTDVKGFYRLLDSETRSDMDFVRLYQDQERLIGTTPDAKKALTEVQEAFDDIEEKEEICGVGLQPREALLFSNACARRENTQKDILENVSNSVMHGKIGYTSNFFRWMERGFFVSPPTEPLAKTR